MRDVYRHRVTGARAVISRRDWSSDLPDVRLELHLLSEPTEQVCQALGLAVTQRADMIYCCELGERYFPSPCPLHGMVGELVPRPMEVSPFTIWKAELATDWDPETG